MNKTISYLEWLLTVWAYWELKFLTGSAGWPSVSSMTLALQAELCLGAKVFGAKTPPFSEIADRMNYIINHELRKLHPDSTDALRAVYLCPDVRLEALAFERHISTRTLLQRARDAKLFLEGRIMDLHFNH